MEAYDDVGIYLKQMNSLPVLTAQEEQKLAKEIEQYREEFKRRALSIPAVMDEIVEQIDVVVNGKKRAETIFESSALHNTDPSKSARMARSKLKYLKDPDYPVEKKIKILNKLSVKMKKIEESWKRHRDPKDKDTDQIYSNWIAYRKKMANHNLRLVVSICKRYKNTSVPMIDLIQEGNLGLMRAIDKYERSLGYKFSTYATWWIKQGITRTIMENAGPIKVPNHMANKIYKVRKSADRNMDGDGNIDIKKISKETGIDKNTIREILDEDNSYLSVDEMISNSDDTFLKDLMFYPDESTPEERADQRSIKEMLLKKARSLPPRMIHLVRMMFGMGGMEPMDPDQCARSMSITRERVYQLYYQAIDRMKGMVEDPN